MDMRRNHSADTVEEEWAKSDRRRNLRFASLGGQGFAGGDSGRGRRDLGGQRDF